MPPLQSANTLKVIAVKSSLGHGIAFLQIFHLLGLLRGLTIYAAVDSRTARLIEAYRFSRRYRRQPRPRRLALEGLILSEIELAAAR